MPGYTHLQRAQPVLLAHHLLAYVFMLERDRERFRDCLAARQRDAARVGGAGRRGVPDRPRGARARSRLRRAEPEQHGRRGRPRLRPRVPRRTRPSSACTCSRLADDLTLWATAEFGFVEFSDAFATGSSIMPQKKNPDVAELIRGKTGRLYGNLVAALVDDEGPAAHLQLGHAGGQGAALRHGGHARGVLRVLPPMLGTLTFRVERMRRGGGRPLLDGHRPRRLPRAQGPAVPRRARDRGQDGAPRHRPRQGARRAAARGAAPFSPADRARTSTRRSPSRPRCARAAVTGGTAPEAVRRAARAGAGLIAAERGA